MSALAGVLKRNNFHGSTHALCGQMLSAQTAYGPDACFVKTSGPASLGKCAKFILPEDLSKLELPLKTGHSLVADIRLDNRTELIEQLDIDRGSAIQLSDTYLLALALNRWGESAVDHLVGPFAFAYWQAEKNTLILARDPLGQRPLYTHKGQGFFAFSSMPCGLLALPQIPKAPNLDRLAYIISLTPYQGNETSFAGIDKVPAGHLLKVASENITVSRYWNPSPKDLKLKNHHEYGEALCEVFTTAVRSCLRGTGDVATHLSGGRDSSSVSAIAAEIQAERGRSVFAYTATPGNDFSNCSNNILADESHHASALATRYPNMRHQLVSSGQANPIEKFDSYFHLYQKPIFNPCNFVWLDRIFDQAKAQNTSVLLVGQMGNATISYRGWQALSELLCTGHLFEWAKLSSALIKNKWCSWRGALWNSIHPWVAPALQTRMHNLKDKTQLHALSGSAIHPHLVDFFTKERRRNEHTSADGFQYRKDWMFKTDGWNENKGALAHWGIDVRDPTADLRVVEFCLSVPTAQFIHNGTPSAMLSTAMSAHVPRLILDERKKGLQAADWYENLSKSKQFIVAELEEITACKEAAEILDINFLWSLVQNWPSRDWNSIDNFSNYRSALMRGLSAGNFIRNAVLLGKGTEFKGNAHHYDSQKILSA